MLEIVGSLSGRIFGAVLVVGALQLWLVRSFCGHMVLWPHDGRLVDRHMVLSLGLFGFSTLTQAVAPRCAGYGTYDLLM